MSRNFGCLEEKIGPSVGMECIFRCVSRIITCQNIPRGQRNSKIPKGQTEIVKSEDRQEHGQQNETKDKHRTHNTTLKTKAGIIRTLKKPGRVLVLRKGKQLLLH